MIEERRRGTLYVGLCESEQAIIRQDVRTFNEENVDDADPVANSSMEMCAAREEGAGVLDTEIVGGYVSGVTLGGDQDAERHKGRGYRALVRAQLG